MMKWMVKIGYTIFIRVYPVLIYLASIWNPKAKEWVQGRKDQSGFRKDISDLSGSRVIWVHAASSGEYLQVLPVMKAYKNVFPETRYVLTFFSPSGYHQWKRKTIADAVGFLPWETCKEISAILNMVKPASVWIVKNEYWFNFLRFVQMENISTYFISTKINKRSHVFLPYFRQIISQVNHFFVQDENSKTAFNSNGIYQVTVTGDSRIDHVRTLSLEKSTFPKIDQLRNNKKHVFIYGSIYKEDIPMIGPLIESNPEDLHLLVPHDVSGLNVDQIVDRLNLNVCLYSSTLEPSSPVVIDVLGILNKLYRYADCVYIGGGFNKGIHNTLEPVVYGNPVIFGPNYQKFPEAVEFINLGIARSISNSDDLLTAVDELLKNKEEIKRRSQCFFKNHQGATDLILSKLLKGIT